MKRNAGEIPNGARNMLRNYVQQFADGKMNLDVRQAGGAVLAVCQFTLLGDCRNGRNSTLLRTFRPPRPVPPTNPRTLRWRGSHMSPSASG